MHYPSGFLLCPQSGAVPSTEQSLNKNVWCWTSGDPRASRGRTTVYPLSSHPVSVLPHPFLPFLLPFPQQESHFWNKGSPVGNLPTSCMYSLHISPHCCKPGSPERWLECFFLCSKTITDSPVPDVLSTSASWLLRLIPIGPLHFFNFITYILSKFHAPAKRKYFLFPEHVISSPLNLSFMWFPGHGSTLHSKYTWGNLPPTEAQPWAPPPSWVFSDQSFLTLCVSLVILSIFILEHYSLYLWF